MTMFKKVKQSLKYSFAASYVKRVLINSTIVVDDELHPTEKIIVCVCARCFSSTKCHKNPLKCFQQIRQSAKEWQKIKLNPVHIENPLRHHMCISILKSECEINSTCT